MPRPPKKPKERAEYRLQIRLNVAERRLIERAAKADGAKPSTWARGVLLSAASPQK